MLKEKNFVIRDKYSNSMEDFKRPRSCGDSSDLDENLTGPIEAQKNFHLNKFFALFDFKKHGFDNVSCELLFEYLSLILS